MAGVELPKYCVKCKEIDVLEALKSGRAFRHQDNYEALEEAASSGCCLCRVFVHVLIAEQSTKCKQTRSEAASTLRKSSGWSLWIYIYVNAGSLTWRDDAGRRKGDQFRTPSFTVFHASGSFEWPGNTRLQTRLVSAYPDLGLGSRWIASCCNAHRRCPALADRKLPTRLLRVEENNGIHKLKLEETAGNMGQYVTLSHCWGAAKRFMTTKANYSYHLRTVPFDDLPLTFQDAVRVTAMLGFRYLWIDSVCIVQEDREDWQRECARMAQIYQDCAVTIAGPASSSADGGLIHPRSVAPSCEVPVYDGAKNIVGSIAVGVQHRAWRWVEWNSPLTERAWVLQERLLSPRVLYFGSLQLYFERNTCSRFEAFYNGSADADHWCDDNQDPDLTGFLDLPKALLDLLQRDDIRHRPYFWWKRIVRNYSRCKLTEGHDKLPALSGLARNFCQLTDDRYLAGIWYGDIRLSLCWAVDFREPIGMQGRSLRAAQYAAPSWSWASADHQIEFSPEQDDCGGDYDYPSGYLAHTFELISASVTKDGVDEFGEVTFGSMVLQAPLKQSVVKRTNIENPTRWDLMFYLCRSKSDETPVATFLPDRTSWFATAAGYSEEIHCLFIVSSRSHRFVALALQPTAATEGARAFHRIGKLVQPSDSPMRPREYDQITNMGDWFEDAPVEQVTIL